MSTGTYTAQWPIEDIDLPMSALITQALADLPAMLRRSGAELIGEPNWTVTEHAGTAFLNMEALAYGVPGKVA